MVIQKRLITGTNKLNRKKVRNEGVTIHWTANMNKGAGAKGHFGYCNRKGFYNPEDGEMYEDSDFKRKFVYGCAQFYVDDTDIMQYIESHMFAPHAGGSKYTALKTKLYGSKYSPNYFADGIELCVNPDSDINQTLENGAWLAAKLLRDQKKTPDKWLFRHYDMTGKECPAFMITPAIWKKYKGESTIEFLDFEEFRGMVQFYFDRPEIKEPLVYNDGYSSRHKKAPSNPSNWAVPAVNALKAAKTLNDEVYSDFQSNVTRKRFTYMAVRLYEVLTNSRASSAAPTSTFTDTKDEYILKAVSLGLVGGYGNGTFGPDDKLTREQAAVILMKVCDKGKLTLNQSGSNVFKDQDQISQWAIDAVNRAYANGIISGVGNDNFNPKGPATNEQSLQLVYNILKKARKI